MRFYLNQDPLVQQIATHQESAGDIQSEPAILHAARLDAVLTKPSAIFGLWRQAKKAADDAYVNDTMKQRDSIDEEEAKVKRTERALLRSARLLW